MMTQTSMQRFWILTKVLIFPLTWLKWMMALGTALTLIGLPIYLIWQNPICAIFGGMLIMVNITMNCASLPSQMLALNSSKQFGMLPGLRKEAGVIYFMFSLLTSIAITFVIALKNHENWIPLFPAVFVMTSVLFVATLSITSRWKWAQGLMFMTIAILPTVYAWLTKIDARFLASGLILGWVIFFRWWLYWRPTQLHKNLFGLPISDMEKNQQEIKFFWSQGIFRLAKAKPKTLLGTLLFGSADGWEAQLKNFISGLVLVLLFLGLFQLLGSSVIDVLIHQADLWLFIACTSSNFAFQGYLFRNLYKLWMFYPKSRDSLLPYLEKLYYPWVLAITIPMVALYLTLPIFVIEMPNDLFLALTLLICSAFSVAFNFYIGIVIYCKTSASYTWALSISSGIMFASVMIVIPLYAVWAEHKAELLPFLLAIITALLSSVVFLRHRAKKHLLKINFLRANS